MVMVLILILGDGKVMVLISILGDDRKPSS